MKPCMYGASFSVKYAREMKVDPKECLRASLDDLGVRRLRLMSYWDIHKPVQGVYDFKELDWQIEMAEEYGAEVTMSLGLRQPRWPESHWPGWARELPEAEWQQALLDFITEVVNRYKDKKCVVSWQLENEARLKRFGLDGNFDRNRLKTEFSRVKTLDVQRPVIMSMSDSWGMPFFGPKPDMYAFSIYRYFYYGGRYRHSIRPPLFYKFRAGLIHLLNRRKSFIHELQAEPWGPVATIDMPLEEQFKSMSPDHVKDAVRFASATKLYPIDIWGLEWWYWLKTAQNQPEVWEHMRTVFSVTD